MGTAREGATGCGADVSETGGAANGWEETATAYVRKSMRAGLLIDFHCSLFDIS